MREYFQLSGWSDNPTDGINTRKTNIQLFLYKNRKKNPILQVDMRGAERLLYKTRNMCEDL